MAKDYFQDIIPSASPNGGSQPRYGQEAELAAERIEPEESHEEAQETEAPALRGIRNVAVPQRLRSRPDGREAPPIGGGLPPRPRRRSSWWIWALVAIILVLGIIGVYFASRMTTVTLTPRSHEITFDGSSQFTAYPQSASSSDESLQYSVATADLAASTSVPGTGQVQSESKAAGMIVVSNDYSAQSVSLIKNTRFQTPDGLVFRATSDFTIPGKSASGPGTVTIPVVADQSGTSYDIGPVASFTVPGLSKDAAMYAGITGSSQASMAGGFSGMRPGVSDADRAAAVANLKTQLQSQAAQFAATQSGSTTATLPGLVQVTFTDLPDGAATGTSAQINESAHVSVPVFSTANLYAALSNGTEADAGGAPVTLMPQTGFSAAFAGAASTSIGSDPLSFTLSGTAQLIWNIDAPSIASALAHKDKAAFATIVAGFPGIENAKARVEPFWSHSFPSADSIKVMVLPAANGAGA